MTALSPREAFGLLPPRFLPVRRFLRAARVLLTLVLCGMGAMGQGRADTPADSHTPPVMVDPSAPARQAIVFAPIAGIDSASSARNRVAAGDAEVYRQMLTLLGFDVTLVKADTIPDLARAFSHFAGQVAPGAEVAVFVLGTILVQDNQFYMTLGSLPPDAAAQPTIGEAYATRLVNGLRAIMQRQPKDLVVVLDRCESPERDCHAAAAADLDGVSILAGRAVAPNPASGAVASLRPSLLPLMQQPGLLLFDLAQTLRQRLAGSDLALVTSVEPSSFSFLPAQFFAHLPQACNRIDPAMDLDRLRAAPLDLWTAACEQAIQIWPFSSYFREKANVAHDQQAFLKAVVSCAEPGAAGQYIRFDPPGHYRDAVEQFWAQCRKIDIPQPPPHDPLPDTQHSRSPEQISPCEPPPSDPAARLICVDPDLGAASRALRKAVVQAKEAIDDPAERQRFAREQDDWETRRNDTCGIPRSGQMSPDALRPAKPCLQRAIEARQHALNKLH